MGWEYVVGVGGPGNHREASRLPHQSPTPPPHAQPSPGLGKDSTICPVPLKGNQGVAWTQPTLWVASMKRPEIPRGHSPRPLGPSVAQRGGLSPPTGLPRVGWGSQDTDLTFQQPALGRTESQGCRSSTFLGQFCLVLLLLKLPFILCGVERERRGTDYKNNMLFGKKLKNIEKHREEIT